MSSFPPDPLPEEYSRVTNPERLLPLPEEYSRVTNPERFLPLHALALERIERLVSEYDVARSEAFAPLPTMSRFESARAPVTLTPSTRTAAPIAIAFTPFPSLVVRYGRWLADYFPSCGCDACRETAEGEMERLDELLDDVVAGRLREELVFPFLRAPRLRFFVGESVDPSGNWQGGWSMLSRKQARALRGSGPRSVQWRPWPKRPTAL